MHITEPVDAELIAVRTFIKAIWNPIAKTGTRPWLEDMMLRRAVTGTYDCDLDVEPTHVLVEILGAIGRDLDNVPITDAEVILVDTLMAATGNRRYGTKPLYGSVGGSKVG
jgi:hypothetical protein